MGKNKKKKNQIFESQKILLIYHINQKLFKVIISFLHNYPFKKLHLYHLYKKIFFFERDKTKFVTFAKKEKNFHT